MPDLWPIERRILQHLDQRGSARRVDMVFDLAREGSLIRRRGTLGPASAARLFGAWSKRLSERDFIKTVRCAHGYYRHHEITPAGRRALRDQASD